MPTEFKFLLASGRNLSKRGRVSVQALQYLDRSPLFPLPLPARPGTSLLHQYLCVMSRCSRLWRRLPLGQVYQRVQVVLGEEAVVEVRGVRRLG